MNKTYTLLGIIFLVVIGATWASLQSVEESSDTEKTIKIGSISALVGTGAGIGEEERNGALLAVEVINKRGGIKGRKLELVSENFGFDNFREGAALTSKLITVDKVHAIVGPQWDEPADVIIPVIEEAQIPTVSGDVTNNVEKGKSYKYFFSTWYDNRSGIRKILSYAESHSVKRIAIIRPVDGGFWKFTADLLVEYAPQYGITIVDDVKLNDPFTTEYRTVLAKVKATSPEAIFIVVTDPTQCPFMKQVKELGITVPIFGTEASGSHGSLQSCGDILENLYFSTPAESEQYKEFEGLYIERFGRKPQYPSVVTSYDAVGVIATALEKTNFAGGEVLRNEIAHTRDYKGASLSPLTFDEKGYSITPDNAWEMKTVRNGAFVTVD